MQHIAILQITLCISTIIILIYLYSLSGHVQGSGFLHFDIDAYIDTCLLNNEWQAITPNIYNHIVNLFCEKCFSEKNPRIHPL